MNKIITLLALLIVSANLNAQFFNEKVKGNGDITTENRTVSNFEKVSVAGSFDVELIKGKEGNITIKADENLMDYIVTEVKDGNLKIKPEKGYNLRPTKTIQVKITFNDIETVALAGSGDIYTNDVIKSDKLTLSIAGSGDLNLKVSANKLKSNIAGSGNINLEGDTDELTCSIAGSGNLNGYNLEAKVTNVQIAGSGDVKVHAIDEVHAKIAGSGDVIYTGDPDIVKAKSAGSGDIKKKS